MRSKLNYLISVSLKRKVCTKVFKIVNLLLLLVIVAICNIDSIISMFGGDFNKKQQIHVIDNTNISYDLFKAQMINITNSKSEEDMKYDIKLYDDEKSMEEYLEENTDDMFIVFDNDIDNTLAVKVVSQEYLDIYDNSYLQNAIYNTKVSLAISNSNIDQNELNKIYSTVDVERIILDENKNTEDESMEVIMTTVFPIVILPFFMLVIYLVQMIGAEINDEKTTRGMEIIISSVSPKIHFFSKVISSNLFVIMQGLLLFIYGAIGLELRKLIGGNSISGGVFDSIGELLSGALDTNFVDKLIYIIPITLILMLLTFLAYSLVAGVLASMTTNTEDFQQIQTPIIITLLVAYYLAILAGTFKGSLFIKIFSMLPFISAILAPSLLVIGDIGITEIIIAIALIILVIYVLIKYGLRVYKVGILNYSSNNLWKKMFKALKEK